MSRPKKCAYDGCEAPATDLAQGRDLAWRNEKGHPKVARYCRPHAEIVADEGSPEYVENCPHCGCRFGVN